MGVKKIMSLGVLGIGLGWVLSGCSSDVGSGPVGPRVAGMEAPAPMMRNQVAQPRTGIATGFGKEVESRLGYTDFIRTSARPNYVTTIRYNDREGAKAMGVHRSTKGKGMQKAAGGLIEWGMTSGWGSLDNYWWRGWRFVVGRKGSDYQVRVKNLSSTRIEVVLSVDGLDAMDGKAASTQKRGYMIAPRKTLVVKGFRTSDEAVAAFKFSSVSRSYANLKHGDTRNVGVIGLALFTERGREPWVESVQRGGARAFAEAPNVQARQ